MRWKSLLILMANCALATGVGSFETSAATANESAGFSGFNGVENVGNGGTGGPVVDVDAPNAARVRWNALDFGVVASETVDSTAALQRALNAAGEAGGGVVELPSGRFRFDGTLTIPTGVTLAGTYRVAPSVVLKVKPPRPEIRETVPERVSPLAKRKTSTRFSADATGSSATRFAPIAELARFAASCAARAANGFCAATSGGSVCAVATPSKPFQPTARKEIAAIRVKRRENQERDAQSIGTSFR